MLRLALILALFPFAACAQPSDESSPISPARGDAEGVLVRNLDRIQAEAERIEEALRPVPLLTAAQEGVFRRFPNRDQLQRARQLGIPATTSAAERGRMEADGRLVRLIDNRYWTVRRLDHSEPLATPDAVALLEEIGRRFQARLERLELPPLRMEVTSVLRTAESQADLRRTNPNAAVETTHLYGTTIDVTYASFRAPLESVVELDLGDAPGLEASLRRIEAAWIESAAARMSRELMAELGHVMREVQTEGMAMVTLEVRQPVYHFTVARRF